MDIKIQKYEYLRTIVKASISIKEQLLFKKKKIIFGSVETPSPITKQ